MLARSYSVPSAMKRIGITVMGPVTSLFCKLDGRGEPRVGAPQAAVDRPVFRRTLNDLGHPKKASHFCLCLKFDTLRSVQPILLHRSEEHTSELQSLRHLVCRLL